MPKTTNLNLTTINRSSEAAAKSTGSWIDDIAGSSVSNMTIIDNFAGNVLTKDNTKNYTPITAYNPATKDYVDVKTASVVPNFETSTNNIKSDGIASVGVLNTVPRADHIHQSDPSKASTDVATINSNGLLSSTDKTKLDSIASNSTKTESSTTNGNIKINNIETKVYDDTDFRGYEASGAGYNWIINGNFDFWQRGVSYLNPTSLTFLSDRFMINSGSILPINVIHSRQQLNPDELNYSKYYYRINVDGSASMPSNTNYVLQQQIENGLLLLCNKNSKLTVSFYARSSIINKKIGISAAQNYGSGGTPSPRDIVIGKAWTLTSNWKKYSIQLNTASISGKNFGTDGFNTFNLNINYAWSAELAYLINEVTQEPFVSAGNIDIAQIKLEVGDIATPFVPRPYAEELALCQRYYEKSYNINTVPGSFNTDGIFWMQPVSNNAQSGDRIRLPLTFKVSKRISPSMTSWDRVGNKNCISSISSDSFIDNILVGSTFNGTTGQSSIIIVSAQGPILFYWVADAEI